MRNVYEDVLAERLAQDTEYGGQKADDMVTPGRWQDLIAKFNERALEANTADDQRYAWVLVAALAVAAVQSLDRQVATVTVKWPLDWQGRRVCCPYHHSGGHPVRTCGGDPNDPNEMPF